MGPKRGSIPQVPLSEAGSPEDLTEVLLVPTPAPSTRARSWGGGHTGAAPGALLGTSWEMETQPHTHWEPWGRTGLLPTGWSQAAGRPGGEGVSRIPAPLQRGAPDSQAALEGRPRAWRHRESLTPRQVLPHRSGSPPGLVQHTMARMLNPFCAAHEPELCLSS